MENKKSIALLAIACVLATGCGGGAGGGGIPETGTGSDFAFGEISGRAAISNPPVSTSSTTVVGTAFTGTFSSLKIRELNPSLFETRIVASSDFFGAGLGLVSMAVDGSDIQKITSPLSVDLYAAASATGKIAFVRFSNGQSINIVNMDGTGLTQLAPSGQKTSIDAAGDKVSYINGATLDVVNVTTKAVTPIPLPTFDQLWADAISADGTTVYAVLTTAGTSTLYAMPADGSGGSRTVATLGTGTYTDLTVSPDNTQIACMQFGTPSTLLRFGTGGGEPATPVNSVGTNAEGDAFSPDGKSIIISDTDGVHTARGIYSVNLSTSAITRLTGFTASFSQPSWTPFLTDRTLIAGGGGLLGTRACGVILGQQVTGSTTSVVAFDVTTPSSVVMTAQKPTSGVSLNNLVFSVDADNITKLAYANTFNWRGIRAIGSGTPVTSANGALVSLDGTNGQVVSLLPYNGTRAIDSKPTVRDFGTVRTFTGHFLAAYDKTGKNLAPNGATTVKLDTKTNVLTVD